MSIKALILMLMEFVNTNCQFTLVDIRNFGSQSDSGVYLVSNLGYTMKSGRAGIMNTNGRDYCLFKI